MDDVTVTGSADLSCDEAVELMTAYLEGGLTEGARERFEHHLALCVGCDNHLDQLRHTVTTTGRLAQQDLPAPLRDNLLAAFRGWKAGAES
jgi:anti-sigma factor RsiW